jgi:dTDP-4-dehydrorhamnose reductase
VFAGTRGNYQESDAGDATDVYGKSKLLGEVDYPHAVTLRTSTIGHELSSKYGLLEWFLAQQGRCKGFNRAVFSGLPNTVFAEVVRDFVIPNPQLHGLYHVGGKAIGKYELLGTIAEVYRKEIHIEQDDSFVIDRSLNSERFKAATGYQAADWQTFIRSMHAFTQDSTHVQ